MLTSQQSCELIATPMPLRLIMYIQNNHVFIQIISFILYVLYGYLQENGMELEFGILKGSVLPTVKAEWRLKSPDSIIIYYNPAEHFPLKRQ